MLLLGPSGTGKTTLAHVVANELQADVYQLAAAVSSTR
jgi:replication-associated recombination protein RarA